MCAITYLEATKCAHVNVARKESDTHAVCSGERLQAPHKHSALIDMVCSSPVVEKIIQDIWLPKHVDGSGITCTAQQYRARQRQRWCGMLAM